ncbi:tetratricopeptide repeat protein [Yoonia sediminilitoris]|uniref:Ca-activated chloride channel family protein n=1 Tax=Yoonia sediminilitoris TaxID=1286148 RepID=A0A2T6KS84_9RHOB|nr:tetratricopeptide repeat protein [Yoonia sediminilitoris]PUB19430.1 Ca-activated chloride channel family protein [Yoonia sediminilitoris]RCW99598.1 Ca-activated chloride channel family protein [Yoonia sediminilitoris]
MRKIIAISAVVLLGLAMALGGTAPFGRLALALGMPRLAAHIFTDAQWRGVAYYRAGQFEDATAILTAAGPQGLYNLGNTFVQQGNYAAALEAYDLALAGQEDSKARANFDLVRAFYAGTAIDAGSVFAFGDKEGPTAAAPIARGDARGAGSGDSVTNSGGALALAELETSGGAHVRRVFDDTFIAANARWLATLEDVPGAFLSARISHEHKRRRKDGTGQEPQETEW